MGPELPCSRVSWLRTVCSGARGYRLFRSGWDLVCPWLTERLLLASRSDRPCKGCTCNSSDSRPEVSPPPAASSLSSCWFPALQGRSYRAVHLGFATPSSRPRFVGLGGFSSKPGADTGPLCGHQGPIPRAVYSVFSLSVPCCVQGEGCLSPRTQPCSALVMLQHLARL